MIDKQLNVEEQGDGPSWVDPNVERALLLAAQKEAHHKRIEQEAKAYQRRKERMDLFMLCCVLMVVYITFRYSCPDVHNSIVDRVLNWWEQLQ